MKAGSVVCQRRDELANFQEVMTRLVCVSQAAPTLNQDKLANENREKQKDLQRQIAELHKELKDQRIAAREAMANDRGAHVKLQIAKARQHAAELREKRAVEIAQQQSEREQQAETQVETQKATLKQSLGRSRSNLRTRLERAQSRSSREESERRHRL